MNSQNYFGAVNEEEDIPGSSQIAFSQPLPSLPGSPRGEAASAYYSDEEEEEEAQETQPPDDYVPAPPTQLPDDDYPEALPTQLPDYRGEEVYPSQSLFEPAENVPYGNWDDFMDGLKKTVDMQSLMRFAEQQVVNPYLSRIQFIDCTEGMFREKNIGFTKGIPYHETKIDPQKDAVYMTNFINQTAYATKLMQRPLVKDAVMIVSRADLWRTYIMFRSSDGAVRFHNLKFGPKNSNDYTREEMVKFIDEGHRLNIQRLKAKNAPSKALKTINPSRPKQPTADDYIGLMTGIEFTPKLPPKLQVLEEDEMPTKHPTGFVYIRGKRYYLELHEITLEKYEADLYSEWFRNKDYVKYIFTGFNYYMMVYPVMLASELEPSKRMEAYILIRDQFTEYLEKFPESGGVSLELDQITIVQKKEKIVHFMPGPVKDVRELVYEFKFPVEDAVRLDSSVEQQVLDDLKQLHEEGHVFSDRKTVLVRKNRDDERWMLVGDTVASTPEQRGEEMRYFEDLIEKAKERGKKQKNGMKTKPNYTV